MSDTDTKHELITDQAGNVGDAKKRFPIVAKA